MGAVKGLFRSPVGNVPTAEVLSVLGVSEPPPPDSIIAWRRAEAGGSAQATAVRSSRRSYSMGL